MNFTDLSIIYLACGAPIGVYYFLQNRNRFDNRLLIFNSLLRFIFWIPFAVQIVARLSVLTKLYNARNNESFDDTEANKLVKIDGLKKSIEEFLTHKPKGISLFEFREIFDRYVGLSLEILPDANYTIPAKAEILRLDRKSNSETGEICLRRRNYARLVFHQKLARRDFFAMLNKDFADAPENLAAQISNLTELIADRETRPLIENFREISRQTIERENVKIKGKEIWNYDRPNLPNDKLIAANLPNLMTGTTRLSGKD